MALVDPEQAKLLKPCTTDLSELRDYFIGYGHVAKCEFRFHPLRKWRFDLVVWPYGEDVPPVALEVQGGVFNQGRHTRGAALLKEWEKLNDAAARGYRIVYCQPKDVQSGKAKQIIEACLY
jgi:hypothetical protein